MAYTTPENVVLAFKVLSALPNIFLQANSIIKMKHSNKMAHTRQDDVFLALKVLAALRENERLCTNDTQLTIDRSGKIQCLSRWVKGETRITNVSTIAKILDSAFCIADTAIQKEELHQQNETAFPHRSVVIDRKANLLLLNRIRRELTQAITGLQNLCVTYSGDSSVVGRVQLIIEKIDDKLQLLRDSLIHISCIVPLSTTLPPSATTTSSSTAPPPSAITISSSTAPPSSATTTNASSSAPPLAPQLYNEPPLSLYADEVSRPSEDADDEHDAEDADDNDGGYGNGNVRDDEDMDESD